MRQDYCDIILVLDESGSMAPLQMDTIGGINKFLQTQREQPGKCVITIMKFADMPRPVYTGRPIAKTEDLNVTNYNPDGNTALLDAVGQAIDEAGSRFKAMKETDRPGKVIFVIVTDGEENSSRIRKKDQIKAMIELQQNVYKWEFVFMGANIDAFAESAAIGMSSRKTLQSYATARSVGGGYSSLALNTSNYRSGLKADMDWTEEQRQEQEDSK
jgi:uncharacterized protein YegL